MKQGNFFLWMNIPYLNWSTFFRMVFFFATKCMTVLCRRWKDFACIFKEFRFNDHKKRTVLIWWCWWYLMLVTDFIVGHKNAKINDKQMSKHRYKSATACHYAKRIRFTLAARYRFNLNQKLSQWQHENSKQTQNVCKPQAETAETN